MPRKKKSVEKQAEQPKPTVDPMYADYVAGKSIQFIARERDKQPLDVLKHIQKEERRGR